MGRAWRFSRFAGAPELAVAPRDLSSTRTVAKLASSLFFNPRWSPDDKQIAFLGTGAGAHFSNRLMLANAAGGEPGSSQKTRHCRVSRGSRTDLVWSSVRLRAAQCPIRLRAICGHSPWTAELPDN
jgi:hypothetical protein